jgi:hypothetical protein
MASPRPELIFVAGPQAGQRCPLKGDVAIIGRSANVDVPLKDQYASREHVKFTLTPDGWIVECISTNGIRIGGRKYKPGKQLLLDSGDVMAIGGETEVLFVAPGDDAEAVLAAWKQTNPATRATPVEAPPVPSEPVAPPPPEPPPEPAKPVVLPRVSLGGSSAGPRDDFQQAAQDSQEPPPEDPRAARSRRVRKYAIGAGVYLAVLAGFVLFMATRDRGGYTGGGDTPRILLEDEVRDALTASLPPARNPVAAQEALRAARVPPPNAQTSEQMGQRYLRVRDFRQYMAHNGGIFDEAPDERRYNTLVTELSRDVNDAYRNGWTREKSGRWRESRDAFQRVLLMVPEHDEDNPTYKRLVLNVVEHLRYIDKMMR